MYKEEKVYTRRTMIIGGEEHYYISFIDAVGGEVEVEVEANVYEAIREHELIEARTAWSDRMYVERLALSDDEIDTRASQEHCTVEKEVLERLCAEEVAKAIEELPSLQRRRFLLHRIGGKTLKKIAVLEGTPSSTVQYGVKQSEKKLKRIYKKFSQ